MAEDLAIIESAGAQPAPDLPTPKEVLSKVEALIAAKQFAEAEALLNSVTDENRPNADYINARGCVYSELGRQADALRCYTRALRYDRQSAGIWNNAGTAWKQLKHYRSATICYQRAIQLSPNEAFLHHNLALCLAEEGRHGEAIAAFSRTIELDPKLLLARWGRARSYLFLANYKLGWQDYEVRLETGQVPIRQATSTRWDGQSYAGKRLIVYVEQGFGDTLWAARYLARVKALGGELIVECQGALYALISSMRIADQVIPAGDPLPDADFHCYFCSLPSFFSTESHQLSDRPYLEASRWRRRRFGKLFECAGDALKVGIVWSGSVTFGKNLDRALSLNRLLLALDLPGVKLFSLQKGPPERELAELGYKHDIFDLAPEVVDFADTAAAVAELDLVIMTDSAVAHLTGALGKPVWVLLGYSAHWLWLLDRSDSPWYGSMKLFRPKYEDDWISVLDRVAQELMSLVDEREAARRPRALEAAT